MTKREHWASTTVSKGQRLAQAASTDFLQMAKDAEAQAHSASLAHVRAAHERAAARWRELAQLRTQLEDSNRMASADSAG